MLRTIGSDLLRQGVGLAAGLTCAIAIIVGLTADSSGWAIALVLSGLTGFALVLVAFIRFERAAVKTAVALLGVLLLQVALLFAVNRWG